MQTHPVPELRALRALADQVRHILPHAHRCGLTTIGLDAALAVLNRAEPAPVDRGDEVATLRLRFREIERVTNTDASHPARVDECARIARAALARDPIEHPTGRR